MFGLDFLSPDVTVPRKISFPKRKEKLKRRKEIKRNL